MHSGPSEFGTKWFRDLGLVISVPNFGDFGTYISYIVFSLLKFHMLTFIFQKFYKVFDLLKCDCLLKGLYTHNYRLY